jgi:hypothetical protein
MVEKFTHGYDGHIDFLDEEGKLEILN